MTRKTPLVALLVLFTFFLAGCPKRPPAPPPPVEKPPFVNPIDRVLEILSFAKTVQAKASIRIDMVKDGEKQYYLLNGFILYQGPDRLRILGYHPLGMGLFDAFYRGGEFSLLIPLQKIAFSGEVSRVEDALRAAGEIQVNFWKDETRDIPNRVRIHIVDKGIEIDLRLKEIQVNQELPEDAFRWSLPEGVNEIPLSGLLKSIK